MKTNFHSAIENALKYKDIELEESISEKFRDLVADCEKDLDREAERFERAIHDMIDKLNSNYRIDLRSRRDNIVEEVFSSLSKS